MSMSMTGSTSSEAAATFGGFIDAIGGIAAIVLAVIALSGEKSLMLLSISVIVFGAALMIQGGAMLSEYARLLYPSTGEALAEPFDSGSLSAVFLSGAAGIVLGVLALLDVYSALLASIAIIVFGGALVVSSGSVMHLHTLRAHTVRRGGISGAEVLATDMAAGSAGVQTLAGLAAIVLGILAVSGINDVVLSLVALISLGATLVMTGSSLSGTVMSLMRPQGSTS